MDNLIKTNEPPFGMLKRESAALILQGLRREAYAGVLKARDSRVGEAYICDLLLDGLGRKLEIRIYGCLTPHQSSRESNLITAAIHGLSFLLKPPRMELRPFHPNEAEVPHLVGRIDFQVAIFRLSVLPYASQGGPAWVCVLEIRRQEGR
ncbi:hypothetical protein [Sulfitobacter sp. R18_1]|uniref:hypothetical protein n=1 Tax=Sulfitobacter sp. R18_1 TaxID=2821104 RepID=UPI001ADC1D10|nr:hypothetical protein [Sulfitobacter sp. R18_1]MBO9432532.1 hypothetical protein [Sulfitobacter sp. R18_1]